MRGCRLDARQQRSRHGPAWLRPALHALVRAIRETLEDALMERPGGEHRFRVYDREGERCLRQGCRGTIRRIVQAGRSTFFCPVCQK